jgi:diacylglycerol kinase family enzyme
VAVVNGNARRVRGGVRARLERALPGGVRLTTSLDQARAVIHDDVQRGLDLVVLAGGDGTVVMGLALIAEACRSAGRPEPAIGILRLGSPTRSARAMTSAATSSAWSAVMGRGARRRSSRCSGCVRRSWASGSTRSCSRITAPSAS